MDAINSIAYSPFTIGIMMLLMNVYSRNIVHEWSSNEEEYRQNILLRRLTIFAICFVGTRNLVVSILLTAGFVILASGFIRGNDVTREGMHVQTKDEKMRASAGLRPVEAPAYDAETKPMFN